MNPEGIVLSEMSQSKKDQYHWMALKSGIQEIKKGANKEMTDKKNQTKTQRTGACEGDCGCESV